MTEGDDETAPLPAEAALSGIRMLMIDSWIGFSGALRYHPIHGWIRCGWITPTLEYIGADEYDAREWNKDVGRTGTVGR